MSWFPYRIRLVRVARPEMKALHRKRSNALLAGLASAALGLLAATPALAATGGGNSLTVGVTTGVRSVTVAAASSGGTVALDTCRLGQGAYKTFLEFPNGFCAPSDNGGYTLTNGNAPAHLYVQGADMTPTDGGKHWTLCFDGVLAPKCANGDYQPGQDQYYLATYWGSIIGSEPLSNDAHCDSFNGISTPGCQAAGGVVMTGGFQMIGPSASTDNSGVFSTTVTWTALP